MIDGRIVTMLVAALSEPDAGLCACVCVEGVCLMLLGFCFKCGLHGYVACCGLVVVSGSNGPERQHIPFFTHHTHHRRRHRHRHNHNTCLSALQSIHSCLSGVRIGAANTLRGLSRSVRILRGTSLTPNLAPPLVALLQDSSNSDVQVREIACLLAGGGGFGWRGGGMAVVCC